ncbi:hypothetical protein EDM76_10900 [bacterium]|nr:MAG: hypothetical protein EDM76_10900 [bacterium]MCL4230373.1 alpha/beta hydrolase [Dehalococcoidia bacterium]
METQEPIQYTRSRDGTTIAWTSSGSGPALVFVPPWPSTLEGATWRMFVRPWWPWKVVTYDRRGFGASEWGVEHSIERYADDLEAVADAAGLESIVLFGAAAGCVEAIVLAARTPRVTRMLLGDPPWKPDKDHYATQKSLMALIDRDFLTFWRAVLQAIFGWGKEYDVEPNAEAMTRRTNAADVRACLELLYFQVDLSQYAPLVQADCVIMHSSRYSILPAASPIELARHIPRARLVIHGDRQSLPPEAPIVDFLRGRGDSNEAAAGVGRSSEHRGPHAARLTTREVEILLAVSRGLTNEAIAQQLFLSTATVARHLANIYNKISVRNRVEAANWANEHLGAHGP